MTLTELDAIAGLLLLEGICIGVLLQRWWFLREVRKLKRMLEDTAPPGYRRGDPIILKSPTGRIRGVRLVYEGWSDEGPLWRVK